MKKSKETVVGFGVSIVLHGALMAAIFVSASHEVVESVAAPKSVSISLSSISEVVQEAPQKKVCDKPKKVHKKPKKVAKKVHKPKPAPKKVLKETPNPVVAKKEPVQEVQEVQELAEVQEEIVEETSEVIIDENLEKELEEMFAAQEQQKKAQEAQEMAQSLQEEFVKTNFEIIREKVLANLDYPRIAKRMGFEGIVHIMLVIDTSGKLLEVMLEKSSGHAILDKSAIKAANRLANEVLPNPQNVSRISLPVYFALR